jgi:hypothetical protein
VKSLLEDFTLKLGGRPNCCCVVTTVVPRSPENQREGFAAVGGDNPIFHACWGHASRAAWRVSALKRMRVSVLLMTVALRQCFQVVGVLRTCWSSEKLPAHPLHPFRAYSDPHMKHPIRRHDLAQYLRIFM